MRQRRRGSAPKRTGGKFRNERGQRTGGIGRGLVSRAAHPQRWSRTSSRCSPCLSSVPHPTDPKWAFRRTDQIWPTRRVFRAYHFSCASGHSRLSPAGMACARRSASPRPRGFARAESSPREHAPAPPARTRPASAPSCASFLTARCPRPRAQITDTYSGITCPAGYFRRSRADVADGCRSQGIPCPAK